MIETSIIVAIHTNSGSIGNQGKLLFRLKEDMQYFKELTISTSNPDTYNVVIMGYNTWKSIPHKFKPLYGRINIVVSNQHNQEVVEEIRKYEYSMTHVIDDIKGVDKELDKYKEMIEKIFYIGGKRIYNYAILEKEVDKLYVTHISDPIELGYVCDTVLDVSLFNRYRIRSQSESISEKNVLDCTLQKKIDTVQYNYVVYSKIK